MGCENMDDSNTQDNPTYSHYTLAGDAMRLIAEWCLLSPNGKPRNPKDVKIRMLAVASAVNPSVYQPKSYAAVARRHGFTRAILAMRVQDFSRTFNFPVASTWGKDRNCGHDTNNLRGTAKQSVAVANRGKRKWELA